MWFQDIARDHSNKTAWAGTPWNQITFEMLTDIRQFDTIKAQIQCPPLLHGQLKTMTLKPWDKITPQKKKKTKNIQVATLKYCKDLVKIMLVF